MITGVRQSKQTRHTYALDSLVSNMPNFVLGAESQSRDSLSCRWVPRLQSRHLPSVSANQRHPSGTSKLPPGHPQPILLLVPLLLVICRRQARGGHTKPSGQAFGGSNGADVQTLVVGRRPLVIDD